MHTDQKETATTEEGTTGHAARYLEGVRVSENSESGSSDRYGDQEGLSGLLEGGSLQNTFQAGPSA